MKTKTEDGHLFLKVTNKWHLTQLQKLKVLVLFIPALLVGLSSKHRWISALKLEYNLGQFHKAQTPNFVLQTAKIFMVSSLFNFLKALTPEFSQHNASQILMVCSLFNFIIQIWL